MPILEFILTHKEFMIILILFGALFLGFGYIKILHAEYAKVKADNAALTTELTVSNNSIKTLQASILDQNSAIDKLKAASDAKLQENQKQLSIANTKAETYHQAALDLMKAKPDSSNKCTAANDLLNQEITKHVKK